ncbi:MAG: hypothetical protein ACE14M_10845 [Terriglobales bacterium]
MVHLDGAAEAAPFQTTIYETRCKESESRPTAEPDSIQAGRNYAESDLLLGRLAFPFSDSFGYETLEVAWVAMQHAALLFQITLAGANPLLFGKAVHDFPK